MKDINPWLTVPTSAVAVVMLWFFFSATHDQPQPATTVNGEEWFRCCAIGIGVLVWFGIGAILTELRSIRDCLKCLER